MLLPLPYTCCHARDVDSRPPAALSPAALNSWDDSALPENSSPVPVSPVSVLAAPL